VKDFLIGPNLRQKKALGGGSREENKRFYILTE
jgi:hypothetical protein